MAVIPQYESKEPIKTPRGVSYRTPPQHPSVSIPRIPAPPKPTFVSDPLGKNLKALGNQLFDWGVSLAKTERANTLAAASASANMELEVAAFESTTDDQYANYEGRYSIRADEIQQKYLDSLTDDKAKAVFSADFNKYKLKHGLSVRKATIKRGREIEKARILDNLDTLAFQAAGKDQVAAAQAVVNFQAILHEANTTDIPIISVEERIDLNTQFNETVQMHRVRNLIQSNPDQARTMLEDGENNFPGLDPEAINDMWLKADTRARMLARDANTADERTRKVSERAKTASSELHAAKYRDRIEAGDPLVNESFLYERYKNGNIRYQEYNSLLTAHRIKNKDTGTNSAIVNDLHRRTHEGEDVRSELIGLEGQIAQGTYSTIYNRSVENATGVTMFKSEGYKNGLKRLSRLLTGKVWSQGVIYSDKNDESIIIDAAFEEYRNASVEAGTPVDIWPIYERFRPEVYSPDTIRGLPKLEHANQAWLKDTTDAADIINDLYSKFETGRITQDELDADLLKLDDMIKWYESQKNAQESAIQQSKQRAGN